MTIEMGGASCSPCPPCGNQCDLCDDNLVPESITMVMSGAVDQYVNTSDLGCDEPNQDYLFSQLSALNTTVVLDLVPALSKGGSENGAIPGCCAVYYGEMEYPEFISTVNGALSYTCDPDGDSIIFDSVSIVTGAVIGFLLIVRRPVATNEDYVEVFLRSAVVPVEEMYRDPDTTSGQACQPVYETGGSEFDAFLSTSGFLIDGTTPLDKEWFCNCEVDSDNLIDEIPGGLDPEQYFFVDIETLAHIWEPMGYASETGSMPTSIVLTASCNRVALAV